MMKMVVNVEVSANALKRKKNNFWGRSFVSRETKERPQFKFKISIYWYRYICYYSDVNLKQMKREIN